MRNVVRAALRHLLDLGQYVIAGLDESAPGLDVLEVPPRLFHLYKPCKTGMPVYRMWNWLVSVTWVCLILMTHYIVNLFS